MPFPAKSLMLMMAASVTVTGASCTFDASGLSPDRNLGPLDGRIEVFGADSDHGDGDASKCSIGPDEKTLMLLSFDQPLDTTMTIPDRTGDHPGTLRGDTAQQVEGPAGCGKALQIPASATEGSYVEVPDSPDWDLEQGSVELWVRFDVVEGGPTSRGIISRDAGGTNEEGHFSIFRACNGEIMARLQRGGKSYLACSDPVEEGRWIHVAVNFGASTELQLYIDGGRAHGTSSVKFGDSSDPCTVSGRCGSSTGAGIDGNSNPWVIGASAGSSEDGEATPTYYHLGGVLDEVHVRSEPRTFGM
jgi:hypothetical protein